MLFWVIACFWAFYASWEALASAGVAKGPDNDHWWLAIIFFTMAVQAITEALRDGDSDG